MSYGYIAQISQSLFKIIFSVYLRLVATDSRSEIPPGSSGNSKPALPQLDGHNSDTTDGNDGTLKKKIKRPRSLHVPSADTSATASSSFISSRDAVGPMDDIEDSTDEESKRKRRKLTSSKVSSQILLYWFK